jgi:hypothetical protein
MSQFNYTTLEEFQKHECIVGDEMKIKEGLVYKTNGELVGFTDLGDIDNMLSCFESLENQNKQLELATSVFTLMIRGLFIKINFPYASFPTNVLSGEQILGILMEATYHLQKCGFKMIAHTLDGLSANRRYFQLVGDHSQASNNKLCYKCKNPFAPERNIFISDPPHLMKTTRNCFANPKRQLMVIIHVHHSYKIFFMQYNGQIISWVLYPNFTREQENQKVSPHSQN